MTMFSPLSAIFWIFAYSRSFWIFSVILDIFSHSFSTISVQDLPSFSPLPSIFDTFRQLRQFSLVFCFQRADFPPSSRRQSPKKRFKTTLTISIFDSRCIHSIIVINAHRQKTMRFYRYIRIVECYLCYAILLQLSKMFQLQWLNNKQCKAKLLTAQR